MTGRLNLIVGTLEETTARIRIAAFALLDQPVALNGAVAFASLEFLILPGIRLPCNILAPSLIRHSPLLLAGWLCTYIRTGLVLTQGC